MTQTNQRWMLSIEKEVLCEGTSFVLGLAVVFSSYDNFNLQYQHDAACTLEFIQRSDQGTKSHWENSDRPGPPPALHKPPFDMSHS